MHIPLVFLARLDTARFGNLTNRHGDEALPESGGRQIVLGVPYDPVMSTLEDYLTEDNWYSVEMAVSEDGTLFHGGDAGGMMAEHFEELAALEPEKRWARALAIVRDWAASDVARVVHSDNPDAFTDLQSVQTALRELIANQALHVDAYTLKVASDILFALEESPVYPFSESPASFDEWPYLVDFSYYDEHRPELQSVMVFVDMHI